MKKLILVLVGMFVVSLTAHAQWSNTGTLTINGTMPAIIQINITDNSTALSLDSAATGVVVGSISERSNSGTGYVVTVESANLGELVGGTYGETFAYSLSIGGANIDLTSPATVSDSTSRTSATGITKTIDVTHGVGEFAGNMLAADTYSDVLTFTIAPK